MPTQNPQKFNVDAARKDGYTDDEILQHLTQSRGFDIKSALADGYSKQEIIDHLSANPAIPQTPQTPVPGTIGGTPPGIPPPPLPQDLQKGPQPQEQAMQQSMGGSPQMVNVPQGQGKEFTKSGQEGYQTGGQAGATALGAVATAEPIITGGIAAAPAVGRTILGSVAGGAAGTYAGKNIGGYFGHPQEGAAIGGTLGGIAGGYRAARGGKIPGKIGEWFGGAEEKSATSLANPMPSEATSTAGVPKNVAELPPPSTTSTTSSARVNAKGITPPPQATYVQKFGAPEKGVIVDPNAPNPPPINKTLVSYDGKQLLQMAKQGDLDAIHELVRNPRGINLREALPNVKFLMEPGRSTRIYGGPGSAKALLPAVGIVGAEFNKLGLADPVNPRQQTTLETMMNGPKWKDFDRSEKIEAVRDILGRK